jgi:putative transposase
MQNGYLAKSTGDAAWRQFATTERKAGEAGSVVVMVDPKNTTQECSRCGALVKKELKDRVHSCECGLVLDRDENAAINILRRGLASVRKIDRSPLARARGVVTLNKRLYRSNEYL